MESLYQSLSLWNKCKCERCQKEVLRITKEIESIDAKKYQEKNDPADTTPAGGKWEGLTMRGKPTCVNCPPET